MTKFQSGQTADEAHVALKSSLQTLEKAKQTAILWFGEILDRKLYMDLGYSSIKHYSVEELGFSETRFFDFQHLSRKLKALPKVKAKVESGELGYTKALVLVTVADKKNEEAWLKQALTHSRRDFEAEVKLAKKEAEEKATGQMSLVPVSESRPAAVVPVKVGISMSPTQFARYEMLWEKIQKQGDVSGNQAEALLEILASYAAGNSRRRESAPLSQIHIHQCPDCEKATVQTGKGELELGQDDLEHALCDCKTSQPGQRNTTSIAPSIRQFVLARARHQCERPGCHHSKFLEVHHKIQRSQGGGNDPENLIVVCGGCHRLIHDSRQRESVWWVKSPAVIYRFKQPESHTSSHTQNETPFRPAQTDAKRHGYT